MPYKIWDKTYFCRATNTTDTFFMKGFILSTLLTGLIGVANAQTNDSLLPKKDTIAKKYTRIQTYKLQYAPPKPERQFWPAAGTLLLMEVLPFSYNHFIAKEEFSNISLHSIGHNLQPKNWDFDDDRFTTNQFAHPYHGNLYFNSFRSNGYNFWQSSAAALSGSLLWEIAGEKQAASPNDLINTTLGGLNLGEMTHRIANKILHPHKKGTNRKWNEAYAFLLNPANGFTRLTQGKWGTVAKDDEQVDYSKISAQFDLGVRRIDTKEGNLVEDGKNRAFGRIYMYYSDSTASLKTPFREFTVRMEFGQDDSAKINNLSVHSSLSAWDIGSTEHFDHRLVLSINYDMLDNQAFYYGAQSVNINWNATANINGLAVNSLVGAGPVILAAIPDPYLQYGEYRHYDYTTGLNMMVNSGIRFKKFTSNLSYRGGIVKTINGIVHSHFLLNALSIDAGYHFLRKWSVNTEYGYFNLTGKYRNYPDFTKKYIFARLFLRYDLNL